MKNSLRHLLPLAAAGALCVSAFAAEPVRTQVRVVRVADAPPGEPAEPAPQAPREKVAFLGVETAPVPPPLAAHLGLARDMGLVVARVAPDSPSTGVLQEHDVLTKFADQLLVDSRQLSVLVRAKKPGDEVSLTLVRAGKEMIVKAKLGERELPRGFGLRPMEGGNGFQFEFGDKIDIERLRELPGIAREELKDVIRVLGNERPHWFAGPRVHVLRREGRGGSTVLNLAEGNFVFSDPEGSVEVNASNGKRQITVKDAAGKVVFDGPIDTDEQRANLPPEVKTRLQKLDGSTIEFEASEEMQQEGAKLSPPTKTKVRRELDVRERAPRWIAAPPL